MIPPDDTQFDYIIVGGGTAGAILAHRLSADPRASVLVIEAGPDAPDWATPPAILDGYPGTAMLNPGLTWTDLRVSTEMLSHNRPDERPRLRPYEQGRVLGGSSAVNGMLTNRGSPLDYADWVARGAKGWGWEDVLPYFKRVEHDMDFDGPLHGKGGRLPLRRHFPNMWSGHAKAAARAFEAAGYQYLPDQNGEFVEGYFPVVMANMYEHRVSTAMAYLDAGTRNRKNLTILADTQVSTLLFENQTCVGVRAHTADSTLDLRAHEVIASAGAILSPALLLRSGIGDARHLQAQGVPIVANLPGVGRRLMDHPSVAIAGFIRRDARLDGRTRRHIAMGMRWSSGLEGAPPCDMTMLVSTKSTWHAVGEQLQTFAIWANKTFSEAGQVQLESPDWRVSPRVDFNLLHDRRDLDRLMAAYRKFAAIAKSPEMAAVVSDPFPASYSDKVRQFGRLTPRNRFLTKVAAQMLDGPAFLRRTILRNFVMEGATLEALLADDTQLEQFIRKTTCGTWHASASCRMGADSDPLAVLDENAKVRGVSGLRVADASIFPVTPCANTSLPTMMVAERVSDLVLKAAAA
jgi:5-(hydroxymethyl)furfural/furfural oxidase